MTTVTEHLEFSWVYDTTPLETFRMVTRLDHLEEGRGIEAGLLLQIFIGDLQRACCGRRREVEVQDV